MEMKVYLREASDASKEWVDITERCVRPSLKLMEGFSSEGKTEDATELSLTIKALNLTDAASFHTSEKLIRLSMDGTVIFEGYSDGKATVDMGISSSFVHVKVSFSSYMALLEDALAPSGGMAFEGKKIYDPSDTQNSLAHLLADAMYANADELYRDVLADVTDKIVAASDVPACIKTLPIVYIPEGEPIYDVFQDILYENGYSYYFLNRQIRILTPWDTDRNAVSYELQDFISKPTLKQQPLRHRSHLSLRLAEYTAEDDATLYDSGDPDTEEGNPQVIEAGESYPEDGEPEELRYENQEDEDKEIVYSVEPELSYTCVRVSDSAEDHEDWGTEPAPVKVTADIKPIEGTVLFENENAYRIGIQRYRVMASKAYWKRYSTTVKDAVKEGDEEEYSADYIPDTESAEVFIALYHLQEWANNAEVQMQTERMSITPGSLIQITELPYRLLVLSRQTSYENPARPLYKYSMIPLVYIESPADITHSRPGGGGNALRYLFLELSAVYFHYDSDGALAPADQEIEARLTRVNIASEPVWSINGTQVQPSAGNPDRLIISPSYMEGRETVTVSVTCGRFSKSMTIARIQDGKGGQPVQLFQWGESFETRPDDLMEVLVWGDLAITINGWALVTNPGDWETEVPPMPEDKPALWCKFWNYNTNDWGYYVMNGKPSVGFTLEISPQAYRLTSRGFTKAGQSIRAICRRENTNGLPVWSLSDSRLTYSETPGGSGAGDITIPIPEMIELASFEITCSIGTIGLTKTLVISGVEEGKLETEYLGIFPSVDSLPDAASEGNLILGDHAVVESSDGNRTPYYWTGTQWAMADGNTPVSIAWKILQDTLYDATTAPGTIQSQSVVNLFAQNFATFTAFIQNLFAQIITVLGEFRFSKTIGDTLATFDITQDGVTMRYGPAAEGDDRPIVFQIDFSTGLVTATNANIKGSIEATQGSFKGHIEATSGLFKGEIETPAFSSEYGTTDGVSISSSDTTRTMGQDLYTKLLAQGLPQNTYLRCKIGNRSETYYIQYERTSDPVGTGNTIIRSIVRFYDADYNQIAPTEFGYTVAGSLDTYSRPASCTNAVYTWDWYGPLGSHTYGGRYLTSTITLSIETGGEGVVIFKDTLPFSSVGLQKSQLYCENGFLKIVL